MRIFLTGANGFIGGSVAATLIAAGHRVRGLVRNKAKAEVVAAHGIEAVIGSLDDTGVLHDEARAADAVINAASSDHRGAVETLISALSGSGKALIHSSGSSIVADLAMGEPSDRIYDEAALVEPLPEKASRVAIDEKVLAAPGIRSVVLCNTMIYGHALGPPAQSVQIPALVRQAKASGVVRYIGARIESMVQRPYRRCRGALSIGAGQGALRHIHLCRERRGGTRSNRQGDRGPTWFRRAPILECR